MWNRHLNRSHLKTIHKRCENPKRCGFGWTKNPALFPPALVANFPDIIEPFTCSIRAQKITQKTLANLSTINIRVNNKNSADLFSCRHRVNNEEINWPEFFSCTISDIYVHMVLAGQPSSRHLDGLYRFQTATWKRRFLGGWLLYWRLLDCLIILWWLAGIFHYYSILGDLNWRNNHCTKYFHYLLMFPISWIIDIDSASVSSTHTTLIHRAIK